MVGEKNKTKTVLKMHKRLADFYRRPLQTVCVLVIGIFL